ncbi:MAG: glycosyltransferase [Candidatus Marinimicrobia bacterium]|nr:glycosyltransferase [Candidatus Neomarinimicrobiota bacterium]
MPEVTVLTAVKNGAAYLAETIDSISGQTFTDWEYIIVDDHSNDSSVEIIKKYQETDARIKLIQLSSSLGPFGAANAGLKEAKGKYIIRNDADDVSVPERIEKQIGFLKSNPALKACASYAQRMDEHSRILPDKLVKATLGPGSLKWYLFLRCPLVHSTACVEREVFEEMGGYDPSFAAQDYRMWSYLARRNILAQIPEILVYFRLTPSGITFTKKSVQQEKGFKVAQDHIFESIGESWSMDVVAALNAFGLVKKGYPVSKAMAASRLWDSFWSKDEQLTDNERSELKLLSSSLRKTFLRRNRRTQPLSVAMSVWDYFFPNPKMGR